MYILHLSENPYPTDLGDRVNSVCKAFPEIKSKHLYCGNSSNHFRFDFEGFVFKLLLITTFINERKEKSLEDFCFVADGPLALHTMGVLKEVVCGDGNGVPIFLNSLLLYSQELSKEIFSTSPWKKSSVKFKTCGAHFVTVPKMFGDDEILAFWQKQLLATLGPHEGDIYLMTQPFPHPKLEFPPLSVIHLKSFSQKPSTPFIPLFYHIRGPTLIIEGPSLELFAHRVILTLPCPSEALRYFYIENGKKKTGHVNKKAKTEESVCHLTYDKFAVLNIGQNCPEIPVGKVLVEGRGVSAKKKDRTDTLHFNSGLDSLWRLQLGKKWKIGCDLIRDPGYFFNLKEILEKLTVVRMFVKDPTIALDSEIEMGRFMGTTTVPDVILFHGSLWQRLQLKKFMIERPSCLILDLRDHGVASVDEIENFLKTSRPLENLIAIALECRLGSLDEYPLNTTKMVSATYFHHSQLLFPHKEVLVPHPGQLEDEELIQDGTQEFTKEDSLRMSILDDDNVSNHSMMSSAIRENEDEERTGGLVYRDERDIGFHPTIIIEFDFVQFYPNIMLAHDIWLDNQGIMSAFLKSLITRRAALKAIDPNSPEQFGLKLLSNKVYGYLVLVYQKKGRSVTEIGRRLISSARDVVNKSEMGRVIYIDSDSFLVGYPNRAHSVNPLEWQKRIIDMVEKKLSADACAHFLLIGTKPYSIEVKKVFSSATFCTRKKAYFGLNLKDSALITSSLEDTRSDWTPDSVKYITQLLTSICALLEDGEPGSKKFKEEIFDFVLKSLRARFKVIEQMSLAELAERESRKRALNYTHLWPCASYSSTTTSRSDARALIPQVALAGGFSGGVIPFYFSILPSLVNDSSDLCWNLSTVTNKVAILHLFDEYYLGPVSHLLSSLIPRWETEKWRDFLKEKLFGEKGKEIK
jgi:hypothetical protein